MILLDIETSGLDTGKCGIWQIGAVEFENPENQFLEEARIDDEDLVVEEALMITGKTEEELRDKNKQTQKQMILNFLEWAKSCKTKLIIGHNVGWDLNFIQNKCVRYCLQDLFYSIIRYKGLDTFSIAQVKFFELNGEFSFKENGLANMGLHKVLELCGMDDERSYFDDNNELDKQGKPHNALEDAKLAGECFSRLVYGKNLFPEFSKFPVPENLKK